MILEILILVISFIVLLAIGVPVAWSIGIACLFTLAASMDSLVAFTTVSQRMATGLNSFSLLAIPFFILAGQIMNQGGIANRLIKFAKALIGALPGGLVYVNVIATYGKREIFERVRSSHKRNSFNNRIGYSSLKCPHSLFVSQWWGFHCFAFSCWLYPGNTDGIGSYARSDYLD